MPEAAVGGDRTSTRSRQWRATQAPWPQREHRTGMLAATRGRRSSWSGFPRYRYHPNPEGLTMPTRSFHLGDVLRHHWPRFHATSTGVRHPQLDDGRHLFTTIHEPAESRCTTATPTWRTWKCRKTSGAAKRPCGSGWRRRWRGSATNCREACSRGSHAHGPDHRDARMDPTRRLSVWAARLAIPLPVAGRVRNCPDCGPEWTWHGTCAGCGGRRTRRAALSAIADL